MVEDGGVISYLWWRNDELMKCYRGRWHGGCREQCWCTIWVMRWRILMTRDLLHFLGFRFVVEI